MPDDHEVGDGRPPKDTQFKKGQSGNPKGRPKGTKNFATDLQEELSESIPIREGNRRVRVSKQRAMIKRVTQKALEGDIRSIEVLIKHLSQVPTIDELDQVADELSPEDRAILEEAILARIASKKEGSR